MENWGYWDFMSPYSLFVVKMGVPFPFPWMDNFLDETGLVIGETTFGGRITERVLNDAPCDVLIVR